MTQRLRLQGLDALRGLALVPVVLVNLGSYNTIWSSPTMLTPSPEGSLPALIAVALMVGLLQAKGITLLTFLVGHGLVLGSQPVTRLKRLGGLGLLHGLLLYFGDILSSYALAGALALRRRRARLRSVVRRGWIWLAVGQVLTVILMALYYLPADHAQGAPLAAAAGRPALHEAQGLASWWMGNAQLYLTSLAAMLLYLPQALGLMLLGMASARLRLFSHKRWLPLWQRLARWAWPLLGVNLLVGAVMASARHPTQDGLIGFLALFSLPSWVAWLHLRRLPTALAALGRSSLSVYLGSSLLLVLLLSGVGLALPLGSVGVVVLGLAYLGLMSGLAQELERRGWRMPLEAWMTRRPA